MKPHSLIPVLFVAALCIPFRHAGGATGVGDAVPAAPATAGLGPGHAAIPEAVLTAAEQGRYWRASRLMESYLATVADTTAETLLLTARIHAGWGDWESVSRLLEGRYWLDRVEGGAGWELVARSRIAGGRAVQGADALRRYIALDGRTDRDRGVAELRRGLALGPAGETEAALTAFERAGEAIPWFRDWSSLLAAETAAAAGDTAAVRARLAAAGTLAEDRAWRIRLRAAREAGDSLGAREVALETAGSARAEATRAAAWAQLGTLRLAAGDTARARAAFVEAMATPGASGAVDGARALTELRPTPREWRAIADIYARHGNARRAAEGYGNYLAAGVGSPSERTEVRLQLGRARFNSGDYDRAERELLALAGEPVPPATGAEALYLAGRAQYRQGRSAEGQRTLAALPDRFPGQPAVTRGLYLLADLKHDDLELAEARRYYRQAAEASPALNEAGLALMRLGGLAMLERDYAGAAAIYEEYRRLHPDGRRWDQSTYWAGRAYEAMGRPADARARFSELRQKEPLSYYGVRAADLLGEPVLSRVGSRAPAEDAAVADRLRERLRRADVLAELDRRGDLSHEVDRLRAEVRGDAAGQYALAEALNERGFTLTAIGMGRALLRESGAWNERLLRIVYPLPFRQIVAPEAAERRLDPYLVAGLIRQESAFNPTVTSGAGAIGLMQVMPETGRALAREVGLRQYEPGLLRQPDINVHLGTRYLATMLERFDHDLPLVLSAYNAGPTRAARWRAFPEARDPELFAERVPYPETRDYIRHVLLNRALYAALYPELTGAAP